MTETINRVADSDDDKRARQQILRSQYATLPAMQSRQDLIRAELKNISDLDDPDEDDLAWQGTLIAEYDDLNEMAEPLAKRAKKLEAIFRNAQNPANVEVPGTDTRTPDLITRNIVGQDPFRDLDRVRRNMVEPGEVRGRALDAIELASRRGDLLHDFAETATRRAQDQFFGQSKVAQHILETGSQEYNEAFREYMRDPIGTAQRTALSLTPSANGGFLLPFVLDPTIILTNAFVYLVLIPSRFLIDLLL